MTLGMVTTVAFRIEEAHYFEIFAAPKGHLSGN